MVEHLAVNTFSSYYATTVRMVGKRTYADRAEYFKKAVTKRRRKSRKC